MGPGDLPRRHRSSDVGGHIAKYEWNQVGGQGGIWGSTTVTTDVPTVTYQATPDQPFALGDHTFQLIVTDDSGNRSTPATATVTVRDDRAPTAVLDLPAEAGLGAGVVLEGRRSFDAAGRVVAFEWTHLGGPGGLVTGVPFGTSGTTFAVPSTPADPMRPGVHTFQLVVTDDSGNRSAPDTATVTVKDDLAPTAALSVPPEVGWGLPIALDGTGSVDHEGRVARYEWNQVGGQGGLWGSTTVTTDVPTVTFQGRPRTDLSSSVSTPSSWSRSTTVTTGRPPSRRM